VISARYSFTKKSESFAIVVIEDVSGQVEVIAWPQVYNQTEEFWQEGYELIVQGKVRVRDDQISVVCDNVRFYEPPQEGEEAVTLAEPAAVAPAEKPATTQPPQKQRLIINIRQTKDAEGDIARLNKIIEVLKDFSGRDEVLLNVINGGDAIPLKLPNIQSDYCPELKQQLVELVGEDGLKVEAG